MADKNTFQGLNAKQIMNVVIAVVAVFYLNSWMEDRKGVDPGDSSTNSSINVINNSMASIKLDIEEIKNYQRRMATKDDLDQVWDEIKDSQEEIDKIKQTRYSREDHNEYAGQMDKVHDQMINSFERLEDKLDKLIDRK